MDIVSEAFTSKQWEELLATALEGAATKGDRGLAQKLVGAGAKIGLALHAAVRGGHGQFVNDLLESEGASRSVGEEDVNGDTPLHIAAEVGNAEMVRSLLLKGADKDATNAQGHTPLYFTARHGHVTAAQALLAAGADVNPDTHNSPLRVAADRGHAELLKVLIENGTDVHAVDCGGSTALHHAAAANHVEAIDLLVEAGADIEARDDVGSTPLHDAANNRCRDAACALLKHGAFVDAKDEEGSTPLQHAVWFAGEMQGVVAMVDLLLRSGADETLVDNKGDAAADMIGVEVSMMEASLAEDMERVSNLLAKAPADRAWRRRGYLILCRAHPDRVQLPLYDGHTPIGAGKRHSSRRIEPAKDEEGGQSDAIGGNSVDEKPGAEWTAVTARLLGMEEGLFRTIVGYL